MPKLLIAFALALALASTGQAHDWDNDKDKDKHEDKDKDDRPAMSAPEIDPGTAYSGLTLLAGGLAVIRGRRRKG